MKKRLKIIILNSMMLWIQFKNFIKGKPTKVQEYDKTKLNRWNKMKIGNKVISSNGKPYYLLTKRGTSNNLMIYFSGGGANWDENTALQPMTISNLMNGRGKYFADIPPYKMSIMKGLLDENNTENHFNDWNIVYIPYTTGDFHIGDNQIVYMPKGQKPVTVRHNGRTNVMESLKWIYQNFDTPEKVVIAGESAGGFGASFWASEIYKHYNEAKTYLYIDSSRLVSNRWPSIIDDNWNADFERNFGYPLGDNIINDSMKYNLDNLTNLKVIQSNSIFDKTLIEFETELNNTDNSEEFAHKWSEDMAQDSKLFAEKYPNYQYYLTMDGYSEDNKRTRHTFTSWPAYYLVEEEGVLMSKWLSDQINHDQQYSVGKMYLNNKGE